MQKKIVGGNTDLQRVQQRRNKEFKCFARGFCVTLLSQLYIHFPILFHFETKT